MLNLLTSDSTDEITKTSAALMLDKHQKDIGEVAFLQESKKEDKMPDFALPPNNPDMDAIDDVANQYMKYGGNVFDIGGWTGDKFSGRKNATKYSDQDWRRFAKDVGYTGTTNKGFQKYLYGYNKGQFKPLIDKLHKDYLPGPNGGMFDDKLGYRWDAVLDNFYGTIPALGGDAIGPDPGAPTGYSPNIDGPIKEPTYYPKGMESPKEKVNKIGWQGYDFAPNGMEALTAVLPGLQSLALENFYAAPFLKPKNTIRLDRINLEDAKQRVQESANLGTREAYDNAPAKVAQSIAGNIRGQANNQIVSLDNQEENTNSQIGNQESQINFNTELDRQNWNTQQFAQTYEKNNLTLQRRNELRANGLTQSINNLGTLTTNLENLSNYATMMSLPYVTGEKNEDGSDKTFRGKDGKLYQRQGVPFGFDGRRRPNFNPSFGSLDTFGVSMNASSIQSQELVGMANDYLKQAYKSGDPKSIAAAAMFYKAILGGAGRGSSPIENANSMYQNMLSLFQQRTP